MTWRVCSLAVAAGLLALSGCGSATIAPVHGRVTCNGKPVVDAAIIFSPVPRFEGDKEPGKPAGGGTDADGRYVMSTYKERDGVLIGKCRVAITLDATVRSPCKSKVILYEVKPGDNEFDIELND